ncbi:hypothetical protein GGTG_10171 [Gaeumannomyces tritici R3-111a-1]|uniref:Uncharacterized protein n=1 Tax=Gaeumannomyces tritici (strain R3-111a-1) TaxID=644352 RepID=J3P9J1_GAET3|nr:hypothetical protein GGTG_10171 [Gaeumannomyces tritici R3-111a-1]EJT73327.1 hypothetical protein GGTG_10171 [Gaeumannomyces tritici R3-111a-1]
MQGAQIEMRKARAATRANEAENPTQQKGKHASVNSDGLGLGAAASPKAGGSGYKSRHSIAADSDPLEPTVHGEWPDGLANIMRGSARHCRIRSSSVWWPPGLYVCRALVPPSQPLAAASARPTPKPQLLGRVIWLQLFLCFLVLTLRFTSRFRLGVTPGLDPWRSCARND